MSGRTLLKVIVDLAGDGAGTESILNLHLTSSLLAELKRLSECAARTSGLEQWPNDCIAVSSS